MLDLIRQRRYKKRYRGTRRQRITRLKLASYLVTGGFVALLSGVFLFAILFAWYAKDLPRPDRVKRVEGFSSIIYDRNGEVVYDIYGDQNRVPVPFEDIPQTCKDAAIAIEDKNFYQHEGFSVVGMLRAFIRILFRGKLEGGSTLTQQLVKNVLLSQERTLPRKLKEFVLAVQIERKFTKDEILQMYLNEAPYGSTAYGIETAASYYFDKKAKDLDDIECVVLAGFPQSPSLYSPFGPNADAYIWRSEQVLRRMREDEYINKDAEKEFKSALPNVQFEKGRIGEVALHFVEYVREKLVDQFGEKKVESGGLRVTTTLDIELQKDAERIVDEEIDKLEAMRVSNGAALVLNSQTGEILAMVGSRDYQASDSGGFKFNVVTQGLRQPGSALKPITYATAFKEGYTPSDILMDVPTEFPGGEGKPYKPVNYDGKWRGPVQLRYALANSINMSAVKLVALVGVQDMLETAYAMGLSTLKPTKKNVNRFGLSVTLGGGEVTLFDLTSAFSVFLANGVRHEPVSILKVTDRNGKVLFEYKPTSGKQVLSSDVSYLTTHILSDNDARSEIFGTRSYLHIPGHTIAVKTGTTDDKRDNWTVGGSKSVVVGVWVGNNDNSPMHPSLASGLTGASPIWNRIIREALRGKSDEPFDKTENIIEMEIDAYGGGLPRDDSPARTEVFIKGTEPTDIAAIYKKIKVSKSDSSKLANDVEIASGHFEEKEFFVFVENDPISTDGKNRWQEGIDAYFADNPDPKFHPPTEMSTEKQDEVVVNILEPSDGKRIDEHDVKIRVEAFSAGNIEKLILYIDDEEYKTFSQSSFSEVVNLDDGVYEIKVRGEDDRGKSAEGTVEIGINEDVE